MPAAAVAGVTAATSVAKGISSGKGAKKAAAVQAQSAREQQAMLSNLYNQNSARYSGEISDGDRARGRVNDLLGLSGNDVNAAEIFHNTPGYQFRLDEALRGVNSNAYAAGMGNSGATLRALQKTGMGVADQTFNSYLGQVSQEADRGSAGKAAMAGISTNYGNSSNNVNQGAADQAAGFHMFKAQNFNNTLDGIMKAGGQAFGSSYGAPGGGK